MLTSADEREMSRREQVQHPPQQQQQPQSRGRHPSAPSQARPRVPANNTNDNAPKSPTHPSAARPPPSQQQQHPHPPHAQPPRRAAAAAPLDPLEALFGGGGLGPFAPAGRREAPSSYATYPDRRGAAGAGEGESEGVVYDDEGIPYLVDPRTGTWYPQDQSPSRVPWYGHGYPRERDLGGYQDARRRSAAAGPPSPPSMRTSQRGRGGGGWMTPDNDYLFGRGGPLGGWGW